MSSTPEAAAVPTAPLAGGARSDAIGITPRPCGDRALLLEVADLEAARRLRVALDADRPAGVEELVPAARTVLVRFDARVIDAAAVGAWATERAADPPAADGASGDHARLGRLEVPVIYDGEDLAWVGEHTGLGEDGVVEAHLATTWRVAFCGFAPGFGYLAAQDGPAADGRLHVPRLERSRTSVPEGSVGLAAELCGCYPRSSPGGWRLLGRTGLRLFDVERDPPALLVPGREVRFVRARDGGA